jgi:hypothetical protein
MVTRDEPRLGVPSEDQMGILTELAHWLNVEGSLRDDEALERLGLDPTSRESSIVTKPHALLSLTSDRQVTFKYPQMQAIFTANAIYNDWSTFGFASSVEDLRRSALEEEIVEYLARLLGEDRLRSAWSDSSSDANLTRSPLIRRNLLAIAVAKLNDLAEAEVPRVRSDVLARLLGGRTLTDVTLADITLERLDFNGWDLRRIHGRGGALLYCPNVYRATTDATLTSLDSIDGSEVEDPAAGPSEKVGPAVDRLAAMLQPWCRKGTDQLLKEMAVANTPDTAGWAFARRHQLVVQERKYRGQKFWVMTDNGSRLLQSFLSTYRRTPERLDVLISEESVLDELLRALR